MLRQVQIKEIYRAILIFLLPIFSYIHLFFLDFNIKYPTIEKLCIQYFGLETNAVVYFLIFWGAVVLLFLLWWNASNKPYKALILLIAFLNVHHLLKHFLDINDYVLVTIATIIYLYATYYFLLAIKENGSSRISIKDKSVALILYLLPAIHFTYRLYPNDTTNLKFLFFDISDLGFPDARTILYILLSKGIILTALLLWYMAEKSWWKYALLSPLIVYTHQFSNLFRADLTVFDEFELSQSGPLLAALALFLVLLSKASENQHRITAFFEAIYVKVEAKVSMRFEGRQHYIEEKRAKLKQSLEELVELEKLKAELEQELQKP